MLCGGLLTIDGERGTRGYGSWWTLKGLKAPDWSAGSAVERASEIIFGAESFLYLLILYSCLPLDIQVVIRQILYNQFNKTHLYF